MRTRFGVYAGVLAIVALLFGSSVAMADGKGKQRPLKLVAVQTSFEEIDVGTPGLSPGDYFVFSEVLYKRWREVGTSGGVCTFTEVVPPYDVLTAHCVATLSLRRGQITLQGLVEIQGEDDPGPFTVAITGGTGAFSGAGGEAVIRFVDDETAIYKLRFDSDKKKKHRR